MVNSFHGRTLAGISATGQEKVKLGFEPTVQGFFHTPFNDAPGLLAAVQDPNRVAMLMEPIQGEIGVQSGYAGIPPAGPGSVRPAQMLLMFDEVQCGLGRTGDWCGWKSINPDIMPDAISWAKGIAGGFPLGAIWVSNRPVTLKTGEVKPLCDLLGPGITARPSAARRWSAPARMKSSP